MLIRFLKCNSNKMLISKRCNFLNLLTKWLLSTEFRQATNVWMGWSFHGLTEKFVVGWHESNYTVAPYTTGTIGWCLINFLTSSFLLVVENENKLRSDCFGTALLVALDYRPEVDWQTNDLINLRMVKAWASMRNAVLKLLVLIRDGVMIPIQLHCRFCFHA